MAMVLANKLASAAQLKPEIKLTQALHDYENILSDEERRQLHSQGLPDATAAINLTTLIDEKCSSRRSQCMGPRLITFLESIQQFSQVVDAFVSSHPEVAALVWGGVKLALLAANNVSSYFDQLSILLMNLGRQCPRIHGFGSLYPSAGLQKARYDYYAAVIRLCKHVTQSLRKPVYTQLSKALLVSFKAEFGPYEGEIARLSQDVQDEASLASQQAQIEENKLQARERSDAQKHRESMVKFRHDDYRNKEEDKNWRLAINHRKLERKRLEALDALSIYDYQKTYRQTRKECIPGTSMWICETPEFHAWMSGTLKTLWFSGRLGSGKSVTSACVAAHLTEKGSPKDITAFFFCRFDEMESLKAKTIIGSIARQLMSHLPAITFREIDQRSIDGANIITALEGSLSHTRQYFVVLDGLDECEEAQVKEVAEIFHSLLLSPNLRIKLFWSSRPSLPNWLPKKFLTQQRINLETVENQSRIAHDINTFIRVKLEEWLEGESPELQINDPTLIKTILDRLEKGSQGMFLWVKFQLQALRENRSDNLIRAALRDLPRDLPETFERILSKTTNTNDIDLARKIFRWVSVAKRPLTVEELREATGTKPLQKARDVGAYVNDMKKAIGCCGNLVFMEEEQQTVHFTHGSAKQYLLSRAAQDSLRKYHIDLQQADEEAGAICVTYLNFPVFNRQVARSGKNVNTTNVTSMVIQNSLPFGQHGNKLALRFLKSRRQDNNPGKSVHRLLEEVAGDNEEYRQQQALQLYSFRSYATSFWLEHTKQGISPESKQLWGLWCNLIKEASWRDTMSSVPWTLDDWDKRATNVIQWVVEQNHCSLAQLILGSDVKLREENLLCFVEGAAERGHVRLIETALSSENVKQPILDLGLYVAAGSGHLNVVERLLQADANAAGAVYGGRTALQAAARGGHLDVIERLLQAKVDVNDTALDRSTALQEAAEGGYLDIAERLLQAKADVNTAALDGRTALRAAAEGGHLDVVDRLLQAKADVNAAAGHGGRTALQAASAGGHLDIVERLLQAKADVNRACGYEDKTALQLAAAGGHLYVVERLLQAKADVNRACGNEDKTALQLAAAGGHLYVVERLLQANADVNAAAGHGGRTALQAASGGGYLNVVERLLQANADVNAAAGPGGRTALQAAAGGGYLDMVERLLQAKADVNTPAADFDGRTALQAAAGGGYRDIVERLIQAKADVNAAGAVFMGRTAFQLAAEGGHLDVVERLRAVHAEK